MREATFNLEALENRIENQASKLENKFKLNMIAAQTESIKPIIVNHLLEVESKLTSVSNNLINTFQLQLKSEIFTQEARLTEFASKITSSFKQALESSVETSKSHFTALKDSMMEHAQSLQMTLTIPRPMKLHQLFNRYLSKPLKN